MERLKIGVIGTGHMGRNHVRNLAEEVAYFDLAGIYDADPEQARLIADQFHTEAFPAVDELLDRVEAVVIAVPSSLHKTIGLKAAEHGVHALIEKPLSINSEDASVLSQAFSDRGLKLQVGHIERFNPVIRELDKIVNKGQIFYLEAHRYSPFSGSGRITDTSVIEDLMIHDIDLICHLMAPLLVTDIRANGERIRSNKTDFATCMLNFGENAHAVISASRVSQNKERAIGIHTEDSYIYADLLARTLTVSKNTDVIVDRAGENSYRQDGIVQKIFVPIREPLKEELLAFYESVVNDRDIAVTGTVGTAAVRICEEVAKRIEDDHQRINDQRINEGKGDRT